MGQSVESGLADLQAPVLRLKFLGNIIFSSLARLSYQPGFFASDFGVGRFATGAVYFCFSSCRRGERRGSLIGKAVVLKTTARKRLQVRVLSSPPSQFWILDFGFWILDWSMGQGQGRFPINPLLRLPPLSASCLLLLPSAFRSSQYCQHSCFDIAYLN